MLILLVIKSLETRMFLNSSVILGISCLDALPLSSRFWLARTVSLKCQQNANVSCIGLVMHVSECIYKNVSVCPCSKRVHWRLSPPHWSYLASFIFSVPWSLLHSSWSGGHLVIAGTSLVCLWFLLWTSAGGQSGALLDWLMDLSGTSPLVIRVSPALGLFVGDLSCWCGESALTSPG